MYKAYILSLALLVSGSVFAQEKKEDPKKEKKTLDQKIDKIGQDLIAQPDHVDTLKDRFVQDMLSITVPPVWKDKGTMLFNDLKLNKADNPPFVSTLPLPERKLVQGVVLTLNSISKTEEEKKAQVLTQVKAHLADYYKTAGRQVSAKEMAEQASGMISGPEKFTTSQGKEGNLYLVHDITSQQANYIVLFVLPSDKGIHFAQFQYFKFIYETELPEDPMELKTFVYPDHQETYVEFSKKMLKTLWVK